MISSQLSKIIIVLGMHRSGTSAITRGLQVLGADLGSNLMPPASGVNEKGFWEDLDIYSFNESLLAKLHSSWDRVGHIEQISLLGDDFKEDHKLAIELLGDKLSGHNLFAFKDPRTTILLPFWQQVFKELNLRDSYLIVLRNPVDIADSLSKRDGFSREKGLMLWVKYTMASVQYTHGKQRCIVHYDDMLSDPKTHLIRIANAFGLVAPEEDEPAYVSYVNEFLTLELRHNNNSEEMLDDLNQVTPFIRDLYFALRRVSRMQIHSNDLRFKESWNDLQNRQDEFLPLLRFTDNIEKKSAQMATEISSIKADIDILTRSKISLEEQVNYLNQAICVRDDLAKQLTNEMVDVKVGLSLIEIERDSLTQKQNLLIQERYILAQEKDSLVLDRDMLIQERDSIVLDRDMLVQERDALVLDRDTLTQQRDTLVQEKDSLVLDRDMLVQERDSLILDRDTLTQQRDTLAQEKYSLTQQRDMLTQERDSLTLSRDVLAQDNDSLTQERNSLTQDLHAFQMELKRVSNINLEIQNSTSWRMTSPLRSIKNKFSMIARR